MHSEPAGGRQGGFRLGRYRVAHQIGEGGSGVVYVALDEDRKAYALKVLRPHVAVEPTARQRLAREVETLARVHHPSVAQVVEADVTGDPPYIVTEYVPAPSLHDVVSRHGPLDDGGLVRLGNGIGQALAHIHGAGVVHRDLKPANVLIDGGEPVLIDFGIAHLADQGRLTQHGMVMGTPGYVAPEVLAGRSVDSSTDWWAWAAMMVFAATGRSPFGDGPVVAVLDRVRRGEADLRGVPDPLLDVLSRGLSPDPRLRPLPSQFRVALLELSHRPRRQAQPAVLDLAAQEQTRQAGPRPAAPNTSTVQLPAVQEPAAASAWSTPPRGLAAGPAGGAPAASTRAMPLGDESPTVVQPAVTAALPAAGAPGPGSAATAPLPVQPATRPLSVQHRPGPGQPPAPRPPGPVAATGGPAPRTPRTGSLLALGAALSVATGVMPVLAVMIAVAIAALGRTVDTTSTALLRRRDDRGRTRSDLLVVSLASPWRLLTSVIRSAGYAIVPLLVGAAISFLGSLIVGSGVGASNFRSNALPLMIGAAAALTLAWWGPGGASLRRGTRTMVRAVAPAPGGAQVFGSLMALVVVAGLWVAWRSSTGQVDWFPLSGAPFGWLEH